MDADARWYYMRDGGSHGPEPLRGLLDLLDRGSITRTTSVCQVGSPLWLPLDQAIGIAGHAPPPLPEPENPVPLSVTQAAIHAADFGTFIDESPQPWRRYFARMLDTMIGGTLMWFLIGLLLIVTNQDAFKSMTDFLDQPSSRGATGLITIFLAIFPNALMIGLTGSSIGKLIFGVRVSRPDGRVIGMGSALTREFKVWFRGLALGFPIVTLFTLIRARQILKEDGKTSWDRDMSLSIRQRPPTLIQTGWNWFGVALIVAILAGLLAL